MCKENRVRHKFRCLIRRIAEHHSLIASADRLDLGIIHLGLSRLKRLVNAHRNVGRLLVQRNHHGAGIAVKADLGTVVADLGHCLSYNTGNVEVCLCRNLTRYQYKACAACRLAGNTAHRILLHAGIQNRVGNRVADLVGMSFGHRFRSK